MQARAIKSSGVGINMSRPFILFHWSPVSRRKSIIRHGLCPGKPSRDKQWRPPYVCFSRSPSLAWALSAGFSERRGKWDLWQVEIDTIRDWRKDDYELNVDIDISPSHLTWVAHRWIVDNGVF